MDAMALLCNLHADGPTTLRSLRAGGCTTLDELAGLPVERVVELLGYTPAAARRFQREGANLRQRLAGEWLEAEEDLAVPATQAPPSLAAVEPGALPVRERELLARVLSRWREEEGAGATSAAPHAVAASLVAEPEASRPLAASDGAAASAPEEDLLAPGELDGLDAELCHRLRAAGVRSLGQLASCVPEEVAAAAGLAYSRVRRLQFLARRRADRGELTPFPPPAAREAPEEKISLAFPVRPLGSGPSAPLFERDGRDGRGGPFA